jgi:hypothetical protein
MEYQERTIEHVQATGRLSHLRLRVEWILFCIKEKEQRLVDSESEKCVRVKRHVHPRTVVEILLKVALKTINH